MSLIKDYLKWVKLKLQQNPELRDSVERLYYNFLLECGYDVTKDVKAFLKDVAERKIPYIDSIGRASRKIQEEFPELRGSTWNQRKKKSTEIKEEIIQLSKNN